MFEGKKTADGIVKDTANISRNIELANISLTSFMARLKDSVTNISSVINDVASYNTEAANVSREVIGATRLIGNEIQKSSAAAAKNTLLLGKGVSDNIKLYGALNESMQRMTFFSDKQIESFQVLGVTANMSAAELSSMATSFDTLGYTTDKTLETMERMTKQARAYGVNVSTFMGGVSKNLKLMTSYNFKDGVDGLSSMVAQAQSLRIDMNNTVGLAEKLMSPETAIETAAGFQMLGGAIGKLGDPFQLLHMAQTDMKGLQQSVVDMASASVQFNEDTGEFDIPITEMYRLREAADLANMSYQEMTDMAMMAAQKTKKLDILSGLDNLTDVQKQLISNMGSINADGNIEITMPDGVTKTITENFADLNDTEIGKLQEIYDTGQMSELDVAKQSMGYLNEIAGQQSVMENMTRIGLAKGDGFIDVAKKITDSNTNILNAFKGDGPNGEKGEGTRLEDNLTIPDSILEAFAMAESQLMVDPKQAKRLADTTYDFLAKSLDLAFQTLEKFDFEKFMKGLGGIFKDSDAEVLDRSNDNTPRVQQVNGENSPNDTNNGQEGTETYQRDDLSVNSINTSSLNINEPTTSAIASNSNLNVSGEVNLKLDNVPTSSSISKDDIAMYLTNNPTAMAAISSQIFNNTGTYGGPVISRGVHS